MPPRRTTAHGADLGETRRDQVRSLYDLLVVKLALELRPGTKFLRGNPSW